MTTNIEEILSCIGYLSEVTFGEIIPQNDQIIRLQQLNHIIKWVNDIKKEFDVEHNMRLNLQQYLNKQKTLLGREQLLVNIDLAIQQNMKQLLVDIKLGSQLLPRIIDIVDFNVLPILQEYDVLKTNIDNTTHSLKQAYKKIQQFQSINSQMDIIQKTTTHQLTTLQNQLIFANDKIIQLQGIIVGLETNNKNLIEQLSVVKSKNKQLIQQIVLCNIKVEEIEDKLLQISKNKTGSLINDDDLKNIDDLRGQNNILTKKIQQLSQQLIKINTKNESDVQKLTLQLKNADLRVKELADESIFANKQLFALKNASNFTDQGKKQYQQIVNKANQRIQQLMIQCSEANNRISQLQNQLLYNHDKRCQTQFQNETKNIQLTTQLSHSQHRIEDLINQLSISNNRITDLQLDIEALHRQSLDKNNAIGYQRKLQTISHQLLISNNKVEEMMRIVANYQNNVIDLQLDKQAIIIQLNDSRNKQDEYLAELKIEKATIYTLKDQLTNIKQSYYQAIKGNIKSINQQIFKKETNELIQKSSAQRQIININQPIHLQIREKSQQSYRGEHYHKKIFEGKIRGSHASSRKEIIIGEK